MSLHDLLHELESISPSPGFSSPSAPVSSGGLVVAAMEDREDVIPSGTKDKAHGLLFVGARDMMADGGLCCGVIGQGGTFCVKRNCSVSAHRGAEFRATPDALYVLKNAEAAYAEPRVSTKKLADELLEGWMNEKTRLSEWRKRFGLVNSADDGMVITRAFLELGEDLHSKAQEFKTPAKRRREEEEDDMAMQLQFSPYRKQIKEAKTVILSSPKNPSFSAQWLKVIIDLDEFADHVGEAIAELLADRDRQTKRNATDHDLLNSKIDHLANMVGTPSRHLGEQFVAPTLWGALAEVAGQVDALSGKEGNTNPTSLIAFFAVSPNFRDLVVRIALEAIIPDLKEGINTKVSEEAFIRVSHALTSRLRDQSEQLSTVVTRLQRLEDSSARSSGSPSGHSDELFRFLGLEAKPVELVPEGIRLVDVAARLTGLESQVRGLIAESTDSAISFAGLGFRSQIEVQAWVAAELKTHSFGLFPDVYTLLDWIYAASDAEDTLLTRLEKLYKLKIESGAEARAMNAFEQKIPRIFHKGKGSLIVKGGESHLTNVPTYDAWWNNGMGMKDRLHDDITTVEEGFKNLIADRLDVSSKAYAIASLALKESVTWLMELINFIDETYESLVRSKFSSAAGWSLTTKLVARIFTDLATVRGGR